MLAIILVFLGVNLTFKTFSQKEQCKNNSKSFLHALIPFAKAEETTCPGTTKTTEDQTFTTTGPLSFSASRTVQYEYVTFCIDTNQNARVDLNYTGPESNAVSFNYGPSLPDSRCQWVYGPLKEGNYSYVVKGTSSSGEIKTQTGTFRISMNSINLGVQNTNGYTGEVTFTYSTSYYNPDSFHLSLHATHLQGYDDYREVYTNICVFEGDAVPYNITKVDSLWRGYLTINLPCSNSPDYHGSITRTNASGIVTNAAGYALINSKKIAYVYAGTHGIANPGYANYSLNPSGGTINFARQVNYPPYEVYSACSFSVVDFLQTNIMPNDFGSYSRWQPLCGDSPYNNATPGFRGPTDTGMGWPWSASDHDKRPICFPASQPGVNGADCRGVGIKY